MDVLNMRQRELIDVLSFDLSKVVTGEKASSYATTRLRGTVCNEGESAVFWRNRMVEVISLETSEMTESIYVGMDNVFGMLYFRSKDYLILSGRGLSSDEKYIINLLDLSTKRIVGTLNAHTGAIYALLEVPDYILVSGGYDKKLIVWDLKISRSKFTPKYTLTTYDSTFRAFAIVKSLKNTIVSVGGEVPGDKIMYIPNLWDYKEGIHISKFNEESHEWAVFCCLTFLKDGKEYIISAGFVKFCIWDVETLSLTREVGASNDDDFDRYGVSMLMFNSKYVVVINCDDCVRLWNIDEDTVLRKEKGEEVGRIGFSSTMWWKNDKFKEFVTFNDSICIWKMEFENYDAVLCENEDSMERKEYILENETFFTFKIKFLGEEEENTCFLVYKSLM